MLCQLVVGVVQHFLLAVLFAHCLVKVPSRFWL